MNEAIGQMLAKYSAKSQEDYQNALKEILQEIILLGLDRGDFFEKAAFYGGTALRILHGLDRFSEDLDFTLLKPNPHFSFEKYFSILARELKAYGFEVALSRVEKNADRLTESAFLKVNTHIMFLNIEGAQSFAANVQKNQLLRIKFEVDVEPATSFASETKTLLLPSPFTVKALTLPCLFAGKMHAVLFRKWKLRVKGRDFYDLVWYLTRKVPLNRAYLQEKIQGTQELLQPLNKAILLELFQDRVRSIDWSKARQDVYPFIKDRRQVDLWSAEFFLNMIDSVEFEK